MVSRSMDPVTFGEMDRQFSDLTEVMNVTTAQLQVRFGEIDSVMSRHEQMLQMLDSTNAARFTSVEETLKENILETKKTSEKSEYLNQQQIMRGVHMDDISDDLKNMADSLAQQEDSLAQHATNTASEMTSAMRNADMLIAEARRVEAVLGEADKCFHNLNGRLGKLESTPDRAQSREGLLNPKNIVVPKINGTNHKEFLDWRDLIDELANQFFPGIMDVLMKVRKLVTTISEQKFNEIRDEVERNTGQSIRWSYHKAKHELGVYMITKLEDKAKLTAEGAADKNGLEMYRLLHQRYDKVTADAEALMTSDITRMGAHQAKNLEDLRDKLAVLQAKVSSYRKRLGKEPSEDLLGSILTTILDQQTRREFVHIGGILGDYEAMKDKITALADGSSSAAMDVGMLAHEGQRDETPVNGGPTSQDVFGVEGRTVNPNTMCWHCNEKGHISRFCPNNDKPAVVQNDTKGGKGAQKGGWSPKGSWGKGKGKGKGKGGKGKGIYGVEAAETEWWDDSWFTGAGGDSHVKPCGSLERAVPIFTIQKVDKCECCPHAEIVTEEVRQGQTYREFIDNYREPAPESKSMFEKFKKETMELKRQKSVAEIPEIPVQSDEEPDHELCDSSDEEDAPQRPDSSLTRKQLSRRELRLEAEDASAKRNAKIKEDIEHYNSDLDKQKTYECSECKMKQEGVYGHLVKCCSKCPHRAFELTTSVNDTTQQEVLEGWNVKVSRSRRLRPIRPRKIRAVPSQEMVDMVQVGMVNYEVKRLNMLERARNEINEVEKLKGEWEPIEMTVDSGAGDTVCPVDSMKKIVADTENASLEGFVVADGTKIPNMGAKEGVIATQEWSALKGVSFQVAPVHKTLLSVSRMVENGHRVVFDKDWSYIEDVSTGERSTLVEKNGLYVLRAWVRPRKKDNPENKEQAEAAKVEPGFQRQGP